VFVPESKGLNDLLREFRGNRNHLAVVIDEFGRIAGLITIEDVLEQIVGEIEDEFDIAEEEGDIFAPGRPHLPRQRRHAMERVAEAFGVPVPAKAAPTATTSSRPSAASSRTRWATCPSAASTTPWPA
jgi:magnesium and cobalt transporter